MTGKKHMVMLVCCALWLLASPMEAAAKKKKSRKKQESTTSQVDEESSNRSQETPVEDQQVEDEASWGMGYDEETAGVPLDKGDESSHSTARTLGVVWENGLVIRSEDGWFQFRPTALLQPLFHLAINPDAQSNLAPHDNFYEGTGFAMQRARFGFQFEMFHFLKLHLDSGWEGGDGRFVDLYADFELLEGAINLRIGYARPWFGRQFVAEETELQMIDYAQAWSDERLALGLKRDIGASIFGMLAGGFEYGAGIWNGNQLLGLEGDEERGIPGNIDFMVGGRVAVHPMGFGDPESAAPVGYESAFEPSNKARLAIGLTAFYNRTHDNTIEISGLDQVYYMRRTKLAADLIFLYKDFSVQGEFFYLLNRFEDDVPDAVEEIVRRTGETYGVNTSGKGMGYYVQAGYYFLPRQLEASVRYDFVDENIEIRGKRYYPALGLTYHFFEQVLKMQFMYRVNFSSGYDKENDLGYLPTTHDIMLMLQVAM